MASFNFPDINDGTNVTNNGNTQMLLDVLTDRFHHQIAIESTRSDVLLDLLLESRGDTM